MNIVQINCSASGSTGNIAKAIHRRLMDDGHCSYVFYEVGNASEPNMFRIGNYFALHFHAILSRVFGKQGYFSHVSTYRLVRKLKRIDPDIVHLHNLHGSYLNLPMLFSFLKRSKARVVLTLHDCWMFTGKCPHFTAAKCEKWKYSCGECPQLSVYPSSKLDTTKKSLADKKIWLSGFRDRVRVVAVSDWLARVASQSFLSQYPIETIFNGIDCSVFSPTNRISIRDKLNLEKKFLILGVSSNWNEQKGLGAFLSLSKMLADDEVIVLVGLTETQIYNMPSNIIGLTKTENRQELVELYSSADVFVNMSIEETFGLVVIEAMACGTPAIVFDSTACPEVVTNETGFVVPPLDIDKVYECIMKIRQNHKDYATACRMHVIENYTCERMCSRYKVLYNEFNAALYC